MQGLGPRAFIGCTRIFILFSQENFITVHLELLRQQGCTHTISGAAPLQSLAGTEASDGRALHDRILSNATLGNTRAGAQLTTATDQSTELGEGERKRQAAAITAHLRFFDYLALQAAGATNQLRSAYEQAVAVEEYLGQLLQHLREEQKRICLHKWETDSTLDSYD
eukprot:2387259-Rhodomonas_salina.1